MMKIKMLSAVFALAFSSALQAQQVRLAKVGLGMTQAELRQNLASSSPLFTLQPAPSGTYALLAETEEESFFFMLLDDKVIAFSLVHLIPAGQQPFLAAGQEPTVEVLRDLVVKQTWKPAKVNNGDTFWLSDAKGAPLTALDTCRPGSNAPWKLLARHTSGESPEGLMEPLITRYGTNCGVSIHLMETPATSEDVRVSRVEIQVADLKALSALANKQ